MADSRSRSAQTVALLVCLLGVAVAASEHGTSPPADEGRWSRPIVDTGTSLVVSLTTNQTRYAARDRFELSRILNVVRAGARAQGDLYVRMQDPAGQFFYLGGDQFTDSTFAGAGTVRSATRPTFRSPPWPLDMVPGLNGSYFVRRTVLAGTLPAGISPGTYSFDATFVRPGGDPRDPSAVITTSLPISVSIGRPSRVGHSAIRVSSRVNGLAVNPGRNTVALARNPGILSLVNLGTERVVFSTPVLDPAEATLGQGLDWGGSFGVVAVNPQTNVAVVTNAQPVYGGLSSFTPFVALVNLSSGRVSARLALDPSPAIADPTDVRQGCLSFFTIDNRVLAVRPLAINSRTNTAVVASVTRSQPERSLLYFIDLASATITGRFFVEPRLNSIAIDEARNRLIGLTNVSLLVLNLGDLSFRFVPFPGGCDRLYGGSRTLAILPDTGEVLLTGATRQADNSFKGTLTVIDVDQGRGTTPVELPGSVSAQDPVLVADGREVLVIGLASGLSRLALVNLDQRRVDGLFETSIGVPTTAIAPAGDAVLLGGDFENLLVLRPGGAAPARPAGGLRVSVKNAATGAALDGATVVVNDVGLAGLTNEGGPVDLAAVPPGPQSVVVSAAGFTSQTVSVVIEDGMTQEVTVRLQPGGAVVPLRGRVLVESVAAPATLSAAPARSALSRQALVGQPGVTIRIPGTTLQVVSGPDGTFRIEQAPVGTFIVDASATDFQGTQEIVPIRRDADNQLILTLLRTLGG